MPLLYSDNEKRKVDTVRKHTLAPVVRLFVERFERAHRLCRDACRAGPPGGIRRNKNAMSRDCILKCDWQMRAEGVLFTLSPFAALVRSVTMRYNEERGTPTLTVETAAEELRSKTEST